MKRYSQLFILIASIFFALRGNAQVQLTLTIPNLGSPYLSEYVSNESNRVLIISNTSAQQQQIFLRGKIEQLSAPGYYFRTKDDFKPLAPIILEPFETRTLFARSQDWAFMATGELEDNVPSQEKRRIQATGILPEGEYQICVQAFDFATEQPLSQDEPAGCQFFMVSLGSPPQLIVPMCGDSIDEEYPLITWSPAIIMQAMPDLVYDLYVVELNSRALNPEEVMEQSILYRGGNPFVVENLHQTFYQLLPGDPPFNPDSRYAICVVARGMNGSTMFENDGRSEICIIYTGHASGFPTPGITGKPAIVSTGVGPEIYQLYQTSHLEGKLLYRYYGDSGGSTFTQIMPLGDLNLMQLQPGNSLQNVGYQGGTQTTTSNTQPANYGNLSAAAFTNTTYQQPPPPQYILPGGYNLLGGRVLKQARIRFTARYAVGNKVNIQHPEDLTYVGGMGYPVRVTGGQLTQMETFQGAPKVVAATTTDNDGNYSVTFYADESFGVITTGPVHVEWGGGEFPAGVDGYGFFRVITMEVEEKWYCHPDVVMFVQPGQALDVPTQVVTVQSYNVRLKIRANQTENQAASAGGPITNAIVKIGRAKTYFDQEPACFPTNEVRIEDYGQLMIGTPQKSWMTCDTGLTDVDGNIIFRRLVKHSGNGGCGGIFDDNIWPADGYYIEAQTHPYQSDFNYAKNWIKKFAPCPARLPFLCEANECAPRSANYIPPMIEQTIELVPKFPKINANSIGLYNNEPYPLPNTTLILLVNHDDGRFRLTPYKTDTAGLFFKQFTTADIPELMSTNNSHELTCSYIMDYFKSGFKRSYCDACGTTSNPQRLQMGQIWKIKPTLEPKSFVKGIVEDEYGQAVHGKVRIGDGPLLPLKIKYQIVEGVNPSQAGDPFPMQINPGGLQQGQVQVQPPGGNNAPVSEGINGNVTVQNGFNVELNATPILSPNFKEVSVIEHPAQSGQQVPLIIQPFASNYFADTFYVDIPANISAPGFDLGTFVIKEKLHRPHITVYHKVLGIGGDNLPKLYETPLEGAEVIISNLPAKVTGPAGEVSFVFGSPSNEFRIRINKPGYIPYDQFVTIPVSKNAFDIEIVLEHGKTLTGTVTRADGGQPIEGARIYTEIGSNSYGPIVLESYTNASGQYTLDGLPTTILPIQATKADSSVTYIGQTKNINTANVAVVNFQLAEAPFNLPDIWNLPVAIESVTPSGNNYVVSGAFIGLPHNARFKPEDETQRLGFTNITVALTGPTGPNGKKKAEPTGTSILTNTLKFRSILNDAHIVQMSGPVSMGGLYYIYDDLYQPVYVNKIRVDKETGNGEVKTRVFTLLEYFRMTYNYDGQFYLGETSENITISSYKGTEDLTMPETYHILGYNFALNHAENPSFTVHNFDAYTDRQESYVHQDSFVLAAKLIVDLPLSNPDKIVVSTGDVVILPNKIIVNEGDEPLEFDLETWHVKTGTWQFKPNMGGLLTSGVITTTLLQFPAQNILITPTSLNLPPGSQIDLDDITLGGVVDLDMQGGAKLTFDYITSPAHDPGHGHWRVVLSNNQQGMPVAKIHGLPGWPAQTNVNVNFIENFSDGFQELTMASNQVVNHYNMIKQTMANITILQGGVSFSGNTNLEIPNLPTGYTAYFVYSKEQGQTKVRVQGLVTTFDSNGNVHFQGDQQIDRIVLDWNHFEVTGGLTISDPGASNTIPLRAKLIKEPNNIRIKIIKVDQGGQLEGTNEQLITLGGGSNGVQRVLQGEQLVKQGQWDPMFYQVRFEGFGGGFQQGQDVMWFKVVGDIFNDASKNDEIKLANIETPFGDFVLVFDFSEMAIDGSLNVANISMGAVTVIEGTINMRMGGLGFYMAAAIRAIYPMIGELNTNFIVGSYPQLSPTTKALLKQNMYVQKLPNFLEQSGIQGLYICANKPFFEIDWEVPLVVFNIGVYATAGFDARFWLNFGEAYGGAHLGALAYADFELYVSVLGICEMCLGVLAELGFDAEYQWVPTTNFSISACGTIGFNVDFCGTSFSESAKLEVGWTSSSNDVYYDATLGESCSGNCDSNNGGCKHF